VDVCGGMSDLRAGVVRMTSPAAFDADPLRLLRAARVAGELGFRIDEATQAAIHARVRSLSDAAAERRRDELAYICALEDAYPSLRLLDELDLLDELLPELAIGKGVSQPGEF